MALHPLPRLLLMRRQNIAPIYRFIIQKPVGRHRLTPAMTGIGYARHWIGCKSFHQRPRSIVETCIAEIQPGKFRGCSLCCCRQRVTQKTRENDQRGLGLSGLGWSRDILLSTYEKRPADSGPFLLPEVVELLFSSSARRRCFAAPARRATPSAGGCRPRRRRRNRGVGRGAGRGCPAAH